MGTDYSRVSDAEMKCTTAGMAAMITMYFRIEAAHGVGLLGDDRPFRARRQENGFGAVDNVFLRPLSFSLFWWRVVLGEIPRLFPHLLCASGLSAQSTD